MNWPFRRRTTSDSARDLALIGAAKRHQRVIETARRMRVELGMSEHPGLEA